ncbi:MAG: hypothetical protein AB1489_10035 [Acidobacteriota bacterium]
MPFEREKPIRVRMSDTLFTAIRTSLDADVSRTYSNLVLYSSFGIVRGRVSRYITDSLSVPQDDRLENSSRVRIDPDVLELDDCEVEHYSNHLPTAHFKKLYVRIEDIQGFAFDVTGS